MVPAQLELLTHDQVREMIKYRWPVASGQTIPHDEEAINEACCLTGGNPRDNCKLCNAALLRASADWRKFIDRDTPGERVQRGR
jgi:hypothetical protein